MSAAPQEGQHALTARQARQMQRDNFRSLQLRMHSAGYLNTRVANFNTIMRELSTGQGHWILHNFSLTRVAFWITYVVGDCLCLRDVRDMTTIEEYMHSMEHALQTIVTYMQWPLELPELAAGAADTPEARKAKQVTAGNRLMRLLYMHDMHMQNDAHGHGPALAFDDLRHVSRALVAWFGWSDHDAVEPGGGPPGGVMSWPQVQ